MRTEMPSSFALLTARVSPLLSTKAMGDWLELDLANVVDVDVDVDADMATEVLEPEVGNAAAASLDRFVAGMGGNEEGIAVAGEGWLVEAE